jgi:DNA-binding CsgD family transcriptional regulator
MVRTILIYGAILAGAAFGLQWLQYRLLAHTHPMELYFALFAIGFLGLGVWAGAGLSHRQRAGQSFTVNTTAQATLGISEREYEVLEQLAAGRSNKEISAQLHVSPNTVKTHLARLYEKLGARRRTEAILKARELGMIR